jgi:hypothetical protein
MTAVVIDLAGFRAKRDEGRQIEELIVKTHAVLLRVDPTYGPRVIAARMMELLETHGAALAAIAPVLCELFVLRTGAVLADCPNPTVEDTTYALATTAASFTNASDLARTLPARVAELRQRLPAEARRFEKLYGPDLLMKEEP